MQLSVDPIERFHTSGFVGPFAAMPTSAMTALRGAITDLLESSPERHDRELLYADRPRLAPSATLRTVDSADPSDDEGAHL